MGLNKRKRIPISSCNPKAQHQSDVRNLPLSLFHFLLRFSGRFLPRGGKDNHQHPYPPICLSTRVRCLFPAGYNKHPLEISPYLSFNQLSSWGSNTGQRKLFPEWPALGHGPTLGAPQEDARQTKKGIGKGENRRMTNNTYDWSEEHVVSN